jgi:hypothetical protein
MAHSRDRSTSLEGWNWATFAPWTSLTTKSRSPLPRQSRMFTWLRRVSPRQWTRPPLARRSRSSYAVAGSIEGCAGGRITTTFAAKSQPSSASCSWPTRGTNLRFGVVLRRRCGPRGAGPSYPAVRVRSGRVSALLPPDLATRCNGATDERSTWGSRRRIHQRAGRGSRTLTELPPAVFETAASTVPPPRR